MAPQLATVDVALNAFILWVPNAQPYHQIPAKLKTKVLTGVVNPEDKASQTISVSFSLRQAPCQVTH